MGGVASQSHDAASKQALTILDVAKFLLGPQPPAPAALPTGSGRPVPSQWSMIAGEIVRDLQTQANSPIVKVSPTRSNIEPGAGIRLNDETLAYVAEYLVSQGGRAAATVLKEAQRHPQFKGMAGDLFEAVSAARDVRLENATRIRRPNNVVVMDAFTGQL